MSEEKQYAERDLMAMDIAGNHYCRHVDHMTREQLHSKSDIAAELGWRDMQIAALKAERDALAAENLALKSAIECHMAGFSVCEACGEENTCGNDDVGIVLKETPATDAILNAVCADTIEILVDVLFESGAITIDDAFTVIEHFAANLRKE